MSAPVLAYPDSSKEYLLETDALKLGLEAVLSQKQSDGRYHPVAFGSRALHGVEVNYHSTKLVFSLEVVHQTFSDLPAGSPLQSPHR